MENFEFCKYTYLHRKAFLYCVNQMDLDDTDKRIMFSRAYFHDIDKLIYYQYMSKNDAVSLHRSTASHHMENNLEKDYYDYLEAIIDYECAAYTKADKPLNAYDTIMKYKPKDSDKLLEILKTYNMDKSYSNVGDKDAQKYMESYMGVSEEDIHQEIINLMWNHPEVYKEYKSRMENFLETVENY